MKNNQGGHKTWKNQELDNFVKKKPWNLRNFENNIEFCRHSLKNLQFQF